MLALVLQSQVAELHVPPAPLRCFPHPPRASCVQGVAVTTQQEVAAKSLGTCVAGASSSCQHGERYECMKGVMFGACSVDPLPAEDCESYCQHGLAKAVQLSAASISAQAGGNTIAGRLALANMHRGMEKVVAKAANEAVKEVVMAEKLAAKQAARTTKEVAKQAARSQKVSAHEADRAGKAAAKTARTLDGQDQAAEALAVEKMEEARERAPAPRDEQEEEVRALGAIQDAGEEQEREQREEEEQALPKQQEQQQALPELAPRPAALPLPSPSPGAHYPHYQQGQEQQEAEEDPHEHDPSDPMQREEQEKALEEAGAIRDVMDQIPGSAEAEGGAVVLDAAQARGEGSHVKCAPGSGCHAEQPFECLGGLLHGACSPRPFATATDCASFCEHAEFDQDHITSAHARKSSAESTHLQAKANLETKRIKLNAALEKMAAARTKQAHAEVSAQRVNLLSASAKDDARALAMKHRVRMPVRSVPRWHTPPTALVAARSEGGIVPPPPRTWEPI